MSTITVPRVRRILDFLLHGRSRRNRPGHALADRNLAMKALPAVQPRRAFLMRTGVITGGNLSLGSLVGFVTLFGITLRNSIMLISHYEHLVNVECMRWGAETALRGASERLAPILMTALVTGPWPATLSDRERRPRSRNRRPDGDRDPRRFGNFYCSEPLGATDPRVATRKLREDCWCQGRLTLLKKRYECHIP